MARRLVHTAAAMMLVVYLSLAGEGSMSAAAVKRPHVGRGSVAAGRAHSVIASPDGRVMTWGAGTRGQLGDGTVLNHATPIVVAGLSDVIAVSAGAAHTVAVTAIGEVYAWGANSFGRLGDGTRTRRVRPVRVRGLASVTMIAAGRAHTLALTTSGSVYAWGRNASGQLGIGNKQASFVPVRVSGLTNIVAIAAGDNHSLAVSRDGRVFTWGDNQFSMLGDGTTKDRDRPVAIALTDVVAVAGGASHSLALRRDGTVYSWGHGAHGALGTGSTRNATTPKIINGLTARAIAAGRQFSGAIRTDGQLAMWGLNESGQLGDHTTVSRDRPVLVNGLNGIEALALGDAHAIAVTIDGDVRTWGEGDLGRLGTGSTADQSTPFEIVSDVPDWGSEPGEDPPPPPPDTIPPTITVSTSPALSDGWMSTPVTVTFACADNIGVFSCSAPVTVSNDGVQQVTGIATDAAGNHAAATIAVKIDRNPPSLSILSPADNLSTSDAELTIAGTGVDAGSGIVDVRCNGEPAVLVEGAISCRIALRPGRNDVVLHALDAVGHNSSAAIAVTRVGTATTMTLTPATRIIEVNEVARLTLRDEFGAEVREAVWTTSEPSIVTLSDDDPPVITATALGTVTITATKDGLSAEATITVSPGLAAGDARWTVPPTPDFFSQPPLFANRVAIDAPAMFTVETQVWGDAHLRAIDDDGQVMWQAEAGGIPILGDSFGGAIVGVLADVNSGTDYRAYKRIGGGATQPWRFESAGALSRPAQARDGTIYAIEYLFGNVNTDGDYEVWDKYATVIDGATGRLISRTVLPREIDQFTSARNGEVIPLTPPVHCASYLYDGPPSTIGPIVGSDGRGYLLVRRYASHRRADCIEPFQRRPDRTIEMGLDLVILSPTAAATTVSVYSSGCVGELGTTLPCDLPVRAFQLMPDAIGGTLVTFERGTQMVGNSVFVQRSLARIPEAGGESVEHDVTPGFGLQLIGQEGFALTYGDQGWQGMDVKTGDVKWTSPLTNLALLGASPDGGLAGLDTTTGELKILDASMSVERTQPFGLEWTAVHESEDWIGLHNNVLVSLVGEFANATRFNFGNGNAQGQLTMRRPGMGLALKSQQAKPPFPIYHTAIKITPVNQRWLDSWYSRRPNLSAQRDLFGNLFLTLGAGLPDGRDTAEDCLIPGTARLVSDTNRAGDLSKPAIRWTELAIADRDETDDIQLLLDWHERYTDGALYACFPEQFPGSFNSNSYVHTLLHLARIEHSESEPKSPSPGWSTILPAEFFRPR